MRSWAALAAGAVAAGAAVAQPPKADPVKQPVAVTNVVATADPLGTLLGETRTAYSRLKDYSCTFTRQERMNGILSGEQVGEMKMRMRPAGVYVRFPRTDGSTAMEVAYSGNRRDDKVRYRKAGTVGRSTSLLLDLDDPKFLADNRHPATEWGMGAVIERVATATAREKSLNNPVDVFVSDFQFAGRNVTRYEIFLLRGHASRYAARFLVFVDKETKLPVRYEAYDEPKLGALVGELLEAYSYTDLKLNPGIGESTFDR
jgi:hypothetical protein